MELLLHTCCAPCSITVGEGFEAAHFHVTSFFYNPNIHPYSEYRLRLGALRDFCATLPNRELRVSDKYDLEEFFRVVAQKPGERCAECYRLRLSETAKEAVLGGFGCFSTTLLVSPYQDHEMLKQVGEAVAADCGVAFIYADFRSSFREGQKAARVMELYRQKYCGCVYSEMERYLGRAAR